MRTPGALGSRPAPPDASFASILNSQDPNGKLKSNAPGTPSPLPAEPETWAGTQVLPARGAGELGNYFLVNRESFQSRFPAMAGGWKGKDLRAIRMRT